MSVSLGDTRRGEANPQPLSPYYTPVEVCSCLLVVSKFQANKMRKITNFKSSYHRSYNVEYTKFQLEDGTRGQKIIRKFVVQYYTVVFPSLMKILHDFRNFSTKCFCTSFLTFNSQYSNWLRIIFITVLCKFVFSITMCEVLLLKFFTR